MSAFEENEISIKSQGGTELTKRGIASKLDPDLANNFQIVCSRVRELEEDKIRVYWLHDLPEDPESQHLKDKNKRDRFHKFVYSSNWQMQQFADKLGMPYDVNSLVIETPLDPIPYTEKSKDEIRIVYFSTPQRGLEILVPVFENLSKEYDNVYLDVFSSYKIYGWEEADKPFEPLFDRCRNHPKITYHGFQPKEVLVEALKKAHILGYPCIWPETSCRVLIESMSAGLMCVHPNLAALPDTSGGLTSMYQFDMDPATHARVFHAHLDHAIQMIHQDEVQNYLKFVKTYADTRFNIDKVSKQWERLLMVMANEYKTLESRSFKKEMFRYRVG
jgi:glycosyltransferase involved in cell wall biosynthesis